SAAPFSPIPFAPGMLSTVSPISDIRSTTRSGVTPRISFTFAASTRTSAFAPPDPVRSAFTPSPTSCIMSLSFETISTSSPPAAPSTPARRALYRQCPDHVVRFISVHLDDRHAHRFAQPAHVRQLLFHLIRHGLPLRLVFFEQSVAKRRSRRIKHNGQVFRLV